MLSGLRVFIASIQFCRRSELPLPSTGELRALLIIFESFRRIGRRGREIIHDHVGIDALAFDEPFALWAIGADFSGGGDSLISQDEFLTRLRYCTVTACSALCRAPRTRCRKLCFAPGGIVTASRKARRCAHGSTAWPRTNACLESMSVVWFPASSETFQ